MKTKKRNRIPIEDIEEMATQGKDVNAYFTQGQMMPPLKEVQRVNVDFTGTMLKELDEAARDLNVSRQAVIKLLLRHSLDQHYLAAQAKEQHS